MKPFIVGLILAACLLGACGQPAQAPTTPTEETPLLTDADIDHAVLQLATETKEVVGLEEGEALGGTELPALADLGSGLSTQAVLTGSSGFVYYLSYEFAFNSPTIYSVYRHNQQTDVVTPIYSGTREIQSVAGSDDGNAIVMSMRQTTSTSSDLELFFIAFDGAGATIYQLTSDTIDNTNVSMSAGARFIVNEESVSGLASIMLRTRQDVAFYTKVVLSNTLPQRQPSISRNGQFITLVRDLANGSDQILRYNTATNGYASIATSTAVLEYPSISEKGNKILWLQNGTTDVAILRDTVAATTQTVLSSSYIGHPSLAGDGLFMAYSNGSNIVTKQLVSGVTQAITGGRFDIATYFGPMWQGNSFPRVIDYLPTQGARGQIPQATIAITFTREMKLSSLQTALTGRISTRDPVTGTITRKRLVIASVNPYQAAQGYGYIFHPQTPFPYDSVIEWTIGTTAIDLLGNPLAQVAGSSFSTLRTFSVTIPADQYLTGEISRYCNFPLCPHYIASTQMLENWVGYSGTITTGSTRMFISFNLGSVLPDAQITSATLNLKLLRMEGNPFGEDFLGSMSLERVNYGSTLHGGSDYNTAPRLCFGSICSVNFFGPPDPIDGPIDVSDIVQADWLERNPLAYRSQYRLRFANSHPHNDAFSNADFELIYDPKHTLTVKYLAP
jgi:Bacterial Ig-like domain